MGMYGINPFLNPNVKLKEELHIVKRTFNFFVSFF